ncbi:discoidin domain-containing protein [Nocardia sp. NPDC005978]|uniref:discoidin domain-containing protein n=1 Tax=Nocardia sp. NPDC005978 TaxID=3156725 RepID=UPI0033AE1ED0
MAAESDNAVLHHRALVLEALLDDSTLDDATTDADSPTETGDDVQPCDPVTDEPPAPPVAPTSPARVNGRAGARINELLSGHPDPPSAHLESTRPARARAFEAPSRLGSDPATPLDSAARGAPLARVHLQLRTLTQGRKRAFLLIGAVVLVAVMIAFLANLGSTPETAPLATRSASPTPAQSTLVSPSTSASAGSETLKVHAAVSKCPPGSTPGLDAFEGVPGKAWSCVRAYRVDGQVLRIDLGGSFAVDSIGIVPGWDYIGDDGTDQWSKYRTASRVSYRFDDPDSTTYTQDTLDQRSMVVTQFDPPIKTSTVTLTVLRSTGAPTVNSTAISSIVITGK